MIKVLRDIVGVTEENTVIIPFSVYNLPEKPVIVEAIVQCGDEHKVLVDAITQVNEDGDEIIDSITKEIEDGLFSVKLDLADNDAEGVYIRVYNDDISFVSPMIIIAKSNDATITTKSIDLDFRPKTIKVDDFVECICNGAIVDFNTTNFDIKVLTCNNATSGTPKWEDMTSEYLSRQNFEFKNNIKDTDKTWSVAVRYVVAKHSTNSAVEISDIKLVIL